MDNVQKRDYYLRETSKETYYHLRVYEYESSKLLNRCVLFHCNALYSILFHALKEIQRIRVLESFAVVLV